MSGNHLPNPIPPRVRRHSSIAQTPAKACAMLEGACTSPPGMAMPVVSYTRLGTAEHGRPSCFPRRPGAAPRVRRRGAYRSLLATPRRVHRRGRRALGGPSAALLRSGPGGGLPGGRPRERPGLPRQAAHAGAGTVELVSHGASGRCARPRAAPVRHPPRGAAAPARSAPGTPRRAAPRERTGAVFSRWLCARRDRIQHTQPIVSSQLQPRPPPFAGWPDTPPPTRQERTARYAFTRRGRATFAKGTSLCASRVERFVIERFTPRFLIDIELVGEGVTAEPRDAVDFDLEIGDWGHVRHRGETCRSDRPVRTRETRTPRGA